MAFRSILPAARRLALRWLALVSLALWFGGFTFYSAVVVPVVGDAMGTAEAGSVVTREVTVTLNWVGVATLAVWWLLAFEERRDGPRAARWTRLGLLALNSGLLVWLFVLHDELGRRLDTGSMSGFYRRHEFYLILSTVQWLASLLLMAVTTLLWQSTSAPSGDSAT